MAGLTIGSLFSGIGGLDIAVAHVTGGKVAWMCEKSKYSRRVLQKNFPGVPIYKDIKTLSNPPKVDVLCGGFPCQDISNAGSREGISGSKSSLWAEYARLIREVRPTYVFLENVASIRSKGLDTVIGDLAQLGFNAEWACFKASSVGAPHSRNRWFCFGWVGNPNSARREGTSISFPDEEKISISRLSGPSDLFSNEWPPHAKDVDGWKHWTGRGLCEPTFRRMPDGSTGGFYIRYRLRALGNSVCPQQAAEAYYQLIKRSNIFKKEG